MDERIGRIGKQIVINKMNKHDIIEKIQKKFGGSKSFYSKYSYDELSKLLSLPKFKVDDNILYFNTDSNIKIKYPKYYNLFKKQIDYLTCVGKNVKSALSKYSYRKYTYYNEQLRANNITDKDINRINRIFKNIPPIEDDIIVYRGITKFDKLAAINNLSKGYVSTSLSKYIADSFAGNNCCLFTIRLPKGSSVLPILSFSKYPTEQEILLPPGGTFTLLNDFNLIYREPDMLKKKNKQFLSSCEIYSSSIDIYVTNDINLFVRPMMNQNGIDIQSKIIHYTCTCMSGLQYKYCNVPYLSILKQLTKLYLDSQAVYTFKTSKNNYTFSIKKGNVTKKIVKIN